jgi:hypothetical protein
MGRCETRHDGNLNRCSLFRESASITTLNQIEDDRAQFDATHPDEVSLVDATQEQNLSTEAAWEALSEWETLEQRAALLDEARRNNPVAGSKPGPVDA